MSYGVQIFDPYDRCGVGGTYGDVFDWSSLAWDPESANPVGTDGNIEADALLVAATADGDPDNDDLRLGSESPCVDAGDPTLLDPDGSGSDIGAFGGPDAW